ncbi:MAG: hypothetical protein ABIK08_13035 [Pseudomonadota bacterium]
MKLTKSFGKGPTFASEERIFHEKAFGQLATLFPQVESELVLSSLSAPTMKVDLAAKSTNGVSLVFEEKYLPPDSMLSYGDVPSLFALKGALSTIKPEPVLVLLTSLEVASPLRRLLFQSRILAICLGNNESETASRLDQALREIDITIPELVNIRGQTTVSN